MRKVPVAVLAALFGLGAAAAAQAQLAHPGLVAGGPAAVQDVPSVSTHVTDGDSSFVNAHGEPIVMQASYMGCAEGCSGGCYGCNGAGGMCGPGGCFGGGGGCFGGGGHGCLGAGCTPNETFGGVGCTTEQCGPYFFDFSAEYLHYSRDDNGFSDIAVSTEGFANEDLSSLDAQTRLSTGGLDTGDLDGFRLTGRLDLGALSVIELSYAGLYDEDDMSYTIDNGGSTRLFSVFSRYGTRTNGDVGSTAGQPIDSATSGNPNDTNDGTEFVETDFASFHSLEYDSELQTAEILYRRYWVGFNPRVSGTLLMGFRYTSLSERLRFFSIGSQQIGTSPDEFAPDPSLTITIDADAENHLAGFEFGGDAWVCLVQGLRIGAEGKVGIYNNDYELSSSSIAADGDPSTTTIRSGNQVAFLTEARLTAAANIAPCWTLKGGYELLYINELALVNDSLLLASPYGDINGISDGQTGASAVTDGDVFYHGFHAGLEYIW